MTETPKFVTLTTTIQKDATEFWSDILGSGWETWEWWKSVKYSDGADWNKIGEVILSIEDPEGDDPEDVITKTLTLDDLVKAAQEVKGIDLDDLDADSGDQILQHAVLGEVVYG